MQLNCERIGRSTTKAFVTPWDNVAYPPPSKFKNGNLTKCQMHGASEVARRAFAFL